MKRTPEVFDALIAERYYNTVMHWKDGNTDVRLTGPLMGSNGTCLRCGWHSRLGWIHLDEFCKPKSLGWSFHNGKWYVAIHQNLIPTIADMAFFRRKLALAHWLEKQKYRR